MDDVIKKKHKRNHNPNWPQILHHPNRILIIGGSGPGKTNSLFNLTSQQPEIHKIYLCAKVPYEAKINFLVNKRESTGLKHFNDYIAFLISLKGIQLSKMLSDLRVHL